MDGIPYASLRANAGNHVGVRSTTVSFVVKAKNEASDSGVTGSSNASAT